ncbi:MAG: histidine phosphatase family protein [Mangrovibacterium sp.]
MIDFWLIRHGETEENINGVCQGQTPGTLTEAGYQQAVQAGETLQKMQFDTIYSSDLLRTMKSTEAVAQFQHKAKIISTELLRERYLASWQGLPFPKEWGWDDEGLPEDAETSFDLIDRVAEFLDILIENNRNETVLAMSHGGLIRAFWTVLQNEAPDSYYQWEAPKNTSISRFQIHDDGRVDCLFTNSVEHLG